MPLGELGETTDHFMCQVYFKVFVFIYGGVSQENKKIKDAKFDQHSPNIYLSNRALFLCLHSLI